MMLFDVSHHTFVENGEFHSIEKMILKFEAKMSEHA
jgi:hypothetical protein